MDHFEKRDNARVAQGEELVAVIEEALRVRDPEVVMTIDRPKNARYRAAMMALDDMFRQVARDEISQREADLSYDG